MFKRNHLWRREWHTAETSNRAPKNRNRRDFWEEEKPRRKRAADKVRREKPAEGDDEVPSAERRDFYPSREPTRGNSQLRYANRRARVVQLNSFASKKGLGKNHVPILGLVNKNAAANRAEGLQIAFFQM